MYQLSPRTVNCMAEVARLWRAAAEGLPLPLDCIAHVKSKTLAEKLVFVAVWNDHGDTVLALLELLPHTYYFSWCTPYIDDSVDRLFGPRYLTQLQYAAQCGSVRAAASLVQAKADMNSSEGETPIAIAARHGHLDFVRFLADAKANLDDEEDTDATGALSLAACHGHADIVSFLLERKADIENTDQEGYTALTYAIAAKDLLIVQLLLRAGADTEAGCRCQDERNGMVGIAAGDGDLATTAALLEANMNVDGAFPDWDCRTPLWYACARGDVDMSKLLLTAKANVNAPQGDSPLKQATTRGHALVVQLLLDAKACIDEECSEHGTQLARFTGCSAHWPCARAQPGHWPPHSLHHPPRRAT
jgi:ankyrin repeat protein